MDAPRGGACQRQAPAPRRSLSLGRHSEAPLGSWGDGELAGGRPSGNPEKAVGPRGQRTAAKTLQLFQGRIWRAPCPYTRYGEPVRLRGSPRVTTSPRSCTISPRLQLPASEPQADAPAALRSRPRRRSPPAPRPLWRPAHALPTWCPRSPGHRCSSRTGAGPGAAA